MFNTFNCASVCVHNLQIYDKNLIVSVWASVIVFAIYSYGISKKIKNIAF